MGFDYKGREGERYRYSVTYMVRDGARASTYAVDS